MRSWAQYPAHMHFINFVLLLLKCFCLFPVNLGKRGEWTKQPWRLPGPVEVEVPEMKKDDWLLW